MSEEDPELAYLKAKTQQGVISIVGGILEDERVQSLIRRAVVRETFKSGCLMALVFVGFMLVYTALKAALNYGWQIDLATGFLLLFGGLQYILKKLRWENAGKD